jgi:Domain of unknown function (DUF4124)
MRRFAHTVRTVCVLMLAMLAVTATAENIYRSVDADGNVTFSNQPPANAVTVDEVSVQPGPSDAAQREAQERLQRQETTANEMREVRERRLQQQQAAKPAAPESVDREDPINQYYGYPDPDTARRDQVRDRLQRRPVQLPARPVQLPARTVPR